MFAFNRYAIRVKSSKNLTQNVISSRRLLFSGLLLAALLAVFPIQSLASNQIPPLEICVDYHCDVVRPVQLSTMEWQKVTKIFSAPDPTPEVERDQIKTAIANLETIVGKKIGTWQDKPMNSGEDVIGQLDCISESRNTTQYLRLLDQQGLIRKHQIEDRVRRFLWYFGTHWTAVIKDQQSHHSYAVDSWFLKNGEPPMILPVEEWKARQYAK